MIEDIPMDEISIHVPAWGTTSRSDSLLISMQFQSTFPRGERQCSASVSESVRHFNPRSRVGNDNSLFRFMVSYPYFNPRSRVGNDLFRNCMCAFDIISIHVPAWGTTKWQSAKRNRHYFNPRSRVGNDVFSFHY